MNKTITVQVREGGRGPYEPKEIPTKAQYGCWAVHEAHNYGDGKLYRANQWGRWAVSHAPSGLRSALFHRLDEAKRAAKRAAAVAPEMSKEQFDALTQLAKQVLGLAATGRPLDCAMVHYFLTNCKRDSRHAGGVLQPDAIRSLFIEDGGDPASLEVSQ